MLQNRTLSCPDLAADLAEALLADYRVVAGFLSGSRVPCRTCRQPDRSSAEPVGLATGWSLDPDDLIILGGKSANGPGFEEVEEELCPLGIELLSCFGLDLLCGSRRIKRSAVRAVRGHCIVGVGYG